MVAAARCGVLAAVAVLAATGGDSAAAATGPSASVGPAVSGVARQGERLVAAAGVWSGSGAVSYRFQWYRCTALGARCRSISGATASTYRVSARDASGTIGLTVRATDSTGTTSAHASLVGPVAAPRAPAPRVQPTITGIAALGGRLTVGNGTWTAQPASYAYSWFRCNENGRACAGIAGATTAGYTVVEADRGRALVARVTATVGSARQAGYSTRTFVRETVGPTASVAPSASGIARRGQRLLASPGTWSGAGTVSYRFQWYRCNALGARCSSISGATAAGYRLVARDVGGTIGLTVRATDSTGTTSAHASLVGPIAAPAPALAARAQPAIAGTPAGGQTLTVGNGAWTAKPSAFAYAWLRCNANGRLCAAIQGATASTYTVTHADRGHALVVRVTASAGARSHASLSARSFVAKPEGPSLTTAPTVSGVARQGARLTAEPGTWAGSGTLSYRYQWYRCNALGARCSSISGATASRYRLGARDVGNTIGLIVRATDSTGTAGALASLVGPVAATDLLASAVQPAITGVAALGGRLTVATGTWTATPASFAYAWFRCNEHGRVCVAIAGATASTYIAGEADRGRTLVARVTATLGVTRHATYSTRVLVAP